ncbi:hypothetical protein HDU84_007270 [Entophlyctis sp. JEL0112]|nr:hypothetical protein HDU84_007270 [Entophlyctis sp. JEL0112]
MLRRTTSAAASSATVVPFDSEHKSKRPFSASVLYPSASPVLVRAKPNWPILVFFVLFGLFTRLYRIGAANAVVWDEAHFGKFAGFYNSRKWFRFALMMGQHCDGNTFAFHTAGSIATVLHKLVNILLVQIQELPEDRV